MSIDHVDDVHFVTSVARSMFEDAAAKMQTMLYWEMTESALSRIRAECALPIRPAPSGLALDPPTFLGVPVHILDSNAVAIGLEVENIGGAGVDLFSCNIFPSANE